MTPAERQARRRAGQRKKFGTAVKVGLDAATLERLDKFAGVESTVGRPEAIRRLLAHALTFHEVVKGGLGTLVVGLDGSEQMLLDAWIAANAPETSRPDAIRRILRLVAMRMPR